jgi:adenylosuccinate synthase
VVRAIVGANWGDEGKGKLTDLFAAESDVVIRFQGGANAGHTIINPYGKFALHQMPSGVFYDHVTNIIANGVALNIPALLREIEQIIAAGVPRPNLMISNRTQIVMPYHVLFDQYEEERLSDRQFGSTKSGIAPFYSDKYAKIGFQVNELFDEAALKAKLEQVVAVKNVLLQHLYGKPALDPRELQKQLIEWRKGIEPYIADTFAWLYDAQKSGKRILLEGQLGALKDPDFGIYPFVTSSSTLAGYGCVGAGLAPGSIAEIVAVTKAYSSAVGAGAFVSELSGAVADDLRRRGGDAGEYGATTGRPRRMGWFDAVATRYGCRVQGATAVALTAIDVLSYLDEIPVCVGYEIDGQVTRDFPVTPDLNRARPVLAHMPGWKTDIRGIREFEQLPENARAYVLFVEKEVGIPVRYISNGPRRDEIIRR